jgi:hypothetical protein
MHFSPRIGCGLGRPNLFACCVIAIVFTAHVSGASEAETSPCLTDLQSIPDFLKANDPGVRDKLSKSAPRRSEANFEQAQAEASAAQNDVDCNRALNGYLHGYRWGHLSVEEIVSMSDRPTGAVGDKEVSVTTDTTERAPRLDFPSKDGSPDDSELRRGVPSAASEFA